MSKEIVYERQINNLQNAYAPIMEFLQEDNVTDIMINSDGKVWVKRLGQESLYEKSITPQEIRRMITLTASLSGKTVTHNTPELDGVIPLPETKARIAAFIEPWTTAPSMCIRKPAKKIFTLKDYVKTERMTGVQLNAIRQAVKNHENILVAGGTGSGKTTLLNAVIVEIISQYPKERIYIVEDTAEIQCSAQNFESLTVPPEYTAHAVRKALRYFPDRIFFGELRYGETALELLKAWNTGHSGGLTTIHANSSNSVQSRLEGLLAEVLPDRAQSKELINEAINMIVHLERGAIINEILYKGEKI